MCGAANPTIFSHGMQAVDLIHFIKEKYSIGFAAGFVVTICINDII